MAYIGRGVDKINNVELLDNITFTSSAGPYNITKGGDAFVPVSPESVVLAIDGVVQSPSSYSFSAATVTFDTSIASTSTMNFMYQIGVGLMTTPSDSSVTTDKIANNAVTYPKIQDIVTANRVLGRASAGEVQEVQVSNDMLVNNAITLNGSSVALGGSATVQAVLNFPTFTSVTPSVITNAQTAVVIAGTNFVSVPYVDAINSSTGAIVTADSVSFASAASITATFTLPVDGTYYIRIENNDGLSVRSGSAALTVSDVPAWVTGSGSLGSFSGGSDIGTINLTATDSVSMAKTSGSFPGGITLNSSAGTSTLTGTESGATVDTTYSFTIRATDAEGQTADRAFSLTFTFGAANSIQFN